MNIDHITSINNIIINGEIVDIHLIMFFLYVISCEICLTFFLCTMDMVLFLIYFALNWYIFMALTNKILLLPLQWSWKLIEYFACAVIFVSPNFSVGSLLKTEISFFFSSIWTDETFPTPKITTFSPQSKLGTEKNHIQYQTLNKKIIRISVFS